MSRAPERLDASSLAVIERLVEAAASLGWTQADLAVRAGIKSKNQLSAAKARRSSVDWDIFEPMVRLLHANGFRREWLLWGELPKIEAIRIGSLDEPVPRAIRRKQRSQ